MVPFLVGKEKPRMAIKHYNLHDTAEKKWEQQ